MTKMKKIGALLLVIVLALSLSVPAFASSPETIDTDGANGEFQTVDTPDAAKATSLIIYKEIKAYNPDASTVNAPTIDMTYTVEIVAGGDSIKDAGTGLHVNDVPVQVVTKTATGTPTISGSVDNGTTYTSGKLAFTPTVQLTTAADGADNRFNLKLDFSGVTWAQGAGVYRFKITETTTTADKNAAGINEGTISKIRYVDVYVKDNDTTPGNYDIYGYVCFMNKAAIDGTSAASLTAASKTEGFVADDDNGTAKTADQYYTYNLTITKDVVNDNYTETTHHQFPFSIQFENATVSAKVLPKVTASANATWTALAADGVVITDVTWSSLSSGTSPKIADSATIDFVGIPCGTQVTIGEKNDVTGVTYTAESTGADTNPAAAIINTGDTYTDIIVTGNTALAKATKDYNGGDQVKVTNTMTLISPTGVAIRVAPFILMLGAGVILFVLSRKRRAEDEA